MIRVMIPPKASFSKTNKAQQPITITNLGAVQSGMVFMHQNRIVNDVSKMAIPFKYTPPAAPSITTVSDVLRTKNQGDMVTVSGLIRWDSETSTPQNSKRAVRDGKLVDSTGAIDISIWSDPRDHQGERVNPPYSPSN